MDGRIEFDGAGKARPIAERLANRPDSQFAILDIDQNGIARDATGFAAHRRRYDQLAAFDDPDPSRFHAMIPDDRPDIETGIKSVMAGRREFPSVIWNGVHEATGRPREIGSYGQATQHRCTAFIAGYAPYGQSGYTLLRRQEWVVDHMV